MDLLVSIIIWVVVGAIAGWLASMVMGTNRGQSLGEDIVVGIIGGILGGFILDVLDLGGDVEGISIPSILVAFFGALVLLFILKAVRGSAQV
ncbi:MAG TPA: GlsB/YeaQ/YmgE family stress response membrane protein [Aggregatilineaceae bacterium]|nr:GlsB/YeaQ/YmgE family stress response membrane protein [Aggregatilineaceae bacterium]